MPHLGDASDYQNWALAAGFRCGGFEDVTKEIARTWAMIVRIFIGNLLRKPRYARFLFNRHAHNRIFAFTIVRLWIAFRSGAMRYGVFTFVKD